MAKEKADKKKKSVRKSDFYGVSDNKIERKKKNCPKCGDGVFLAEHKDRTSCGRCGYTEFKK